MKSLRQSSIALAALLALSLGGKLLASRSALESDVGLFARSTARMLTDSGFSTAISVRPMIVVVEARRDACRMELRDYDPHGTYLATFTERARSIGRLSFVYRGRVSAMPPKVRPLLEYYVRREALRIGMPLPRAPIIAVAASPACDLGSIRWDRVATLPR